jgi:succinate dehydrogenase assembly factor 1
MGHTGFQLNVLRLYRECLAATRRLPLESRPKAVAYVRTEFKSKAKSVDRLDIQRIEFLMRQGRRKVETFTQSGVTAVGLW